MKHGWHWNSIEDGEFDPHWFVALLWDKYGRKPLDLSKGSPYLLELGTLIGKMYDGKTVKPCRWGYYGYWEYAFWQRYKTSGTQKSYLSAATKMVRYLKTQEGYAWDGDHMVSYKETGVHNCLNAYRLDSNGHPQDFRESQIVHALVDVKRVLCQHASVVATLNMEFWVSSYCDADAMVFMETGLHRIHKVLGATHTDKYEKKYLHASIDGVKVSIEIEAITLRQRMAKYNPNANPIAYGEVDFDYVDMERRVEWVRGGKRIPPFGQQITFPETDEKRKRIKEAEKEKNQYESPSRSYYESSGESWSDIRKRHERMRDRVINSPAYQSAEMHDDYRAKERIKKASGLW